MSRIAFTFFATLVIALSPALAAEKIGLSVPLTGRNAPVGEFMKLGAETAMKTLRDTGLDISLLVADDGCDPAKTTTAAQELAGSKIIVGPSCFDTAVALAAQANKDAGSSVPVITFDTRNSLLKRVREYDGLPLYALSAGPSAEAQAFIDLVLPQFGNKPFAILDDGSVHGRSLADDIRLLGEQAGFRPAQVSNFRPLQTTQRTTLRRLQRSGIEAIILAAAPEDAFTILKDMVNLNLDWPVAVGEQSHLLPYFEEVAEMRGNLLMVRQKQLNIANDRIPDAIAVLSSAAAKQSALHGYILVEIAAQAALGGITDLSKTKFKTLAGEISFDTNGKAEITPFAVYTWNGKQPVLQDNK